MGLGCRAEAAVWVWAGSIHSLTGWIVSPLSAFQWLLNPGVLCSRHICKHFTACEIRTFIIPISQMKQLRYQKSTHGEFPGSPVVKTLFSMQGAEVGSLVGELRPHMLCGIAKGVEGKNT